MLSKATWGRKRMELLHDMMEGKRLWTVERFNLRQIKMETGQQVRMRVRMKEEVEKWISAKDCER